MNRITYLQMHFSSSNFTKIRFRPWLRPGLRSGAYNARSPDLLVAGKGDTPPHSPPTSTPSASWSRRLASQWVPRVVKCVGPTRWLIQSWSKVARIPRFFRGTFRSVTEFTASLCRIASAAPRIQRYFRERERERKWLSFRARELKLELKGFCKRKLNKN